MDQLLLDLATKYPGMLWVFVVIGIFRAIFKPTMAVIQMIVKETPGEGDDKAVEGFMQSKVYKALVWLVDYTTSIKLPNQK